MTLRSVLALALLAPFAGCAGLGEYAQGPLQPQSVTGPCRVDSFFFLNLRSVPARMQIANTGEACTLTLINPALNAVVNAALLTGPARHGRADTGLISGNRQAIVSYRPEPGYVGPDKFDVTLEPNAVGITFEVTVNAP